MTFLLSVSQIPAKTAPAWASGPQNLLASAFFPLFYSFCFRSQGFTRPSLHRTTAHPACAKSGFSPGLEGKLQESRYLPPNTFSDSFKIGARRVFCFFFFGDGGGVPHKLSPSRVIPGCPGPSPRTCSVFESSKDGEAGKSNR